ncbi:MAG: hypothetical protein AAFU57_05925 [Bacteroidota bacterium]
MKKRLITPLLLLLVLLLNVRCSEEELRNPESDEVSEEQLSGPTVFHERTSITDLPDLETVLATEVVDKKGMLSVRTHNLDEFGDFTLNYDEIFLITDSLGVKNYAIWLESENPDPLIFYNIVVNQDSDGNYQKPVLAEYVVDPDYYLDWIHDPELLQEFTGSVYYYDLNENSISKSSKGSVLDAKSERSSPCPSVTFGPSGGSSNYLPNVSCWTFVSYGLCETQIAYGTGSSFHGSGSCGAGTGSPILGYGITCGGNSNPPDFNTSRTNTSTSRCGGSGGGGPGPGGTPINTAPPGTADLGSFVGFLDNKLNLTRQQEDFLEFNNQATLILEIQVLLEMFDYSDDAKRASRMTIEASRLGLVDGPFNRNFAIKMNPYVSQNISTTVNDGIYIAYFAGQCAILKQEHPEWSDARIFWEASREMIHLLLDLAGLVPVVGEVADIGNGIIYTIEGDGTNATLSYASAIPFAGWYAAGVKFGKKTIDLGNNFSTTLKWVVKANDVITFGDRSQLRRVLKLAVGDSKQAHHLISWSKRNHRVVQKAAKSKRAFHMNNELYGLAVEAWRNQPNHNLYDTRVQALLDAIPSNLSVEKTYDEVEKVVNRIKNVIKNNPNLHLNDLIF